jgi:hypothetical protein
MDLDVELYQYEDKYLFLTVRGLAQGLVQFPNLNTLIAFLIDCQVLLGSFEETVASNDGMIPDAILKAFKEDQL